MASLAKGTACAKCQRSPGQWPFLCLSQTLEGVICVLGLLKGAQDSIPVALATCQDGDRRPPPHQCPPLVQRKVYLVEAVLMSFLRGVVEAGTPSQAQSVVRQVLDLLWLFMEVRLRTSGLRPGCQAPLRWGRYREGLGKDPQMAVLALRQPGVQPGISPTGLRGTGLPQAVDDVLAAALPVLAHRPRPEPTGGSSCPCPRAPWALAALSEHPLPTDPLSAAHHRHPEA